MSSESLPPTDQKRVDAELIQLLFHQSTTGVAVSLPVIAFCYGLLLRQGLGLSAHLWLVVMLIVTSLRFVLVRQYLHADVDIEQRTDWARRNTLLMLALGATWGSLGPLSYHTDIQTFYQLVFILGGVISFSLITLGQWLPSLLAFMLPITLTLSTWLFIYGDTDQYIWATLLLIYTLGLAGTGKRLSENLRRLQGLNLENTVLIQDLETAKSHAEEASQAKSAFLSKMSHELRTPMNAILGFTQILESDPDEPLSPQQKQSTDEILHAGHHLMDMINDVLDLAKIESGQIDVTLAPTELSTVVQESVGLMQSQAQQAGIQLKLTEIPELSIKADRRRLKQVLVNLVSNAIKYNRKNGSVQVQVETKPPLLHIDIKDTGHGLSPTQCQQIFTPFQRIHPDKAIIEGTGIGLSISKHLVERMNGQLSVSSKPNIGSTFTITLPYSDAL